MKYPQAVVAASQCLFFSPTKHLVISVNAPSYTKPPHSIKLFLRYEVLILYGLTRTKALQSTGGYMSYPWPIPTGIGETVHMFRLLLSGGVAFVPRILWKKQDTGHAMDPFEVLRSLQLSSDVLFRIKRYLLFPLLILYEITILTNDTLHSHHNMKDKFHLLHSVLTYNLFKISNISSNMVRGLYTLLSSIIRQIILAPFRNHVPKSNRL